jgi:hypothetical protein
MFEIDLDYTYFKDVVNSKKLLWQYTENIKQYNIFAIDESVKYNTRIFKNPETEIGIDVEQETANKIDFETNYKDNANEPLVYTQTAGHSQFIGKQIEMTAEETEKSCEWSFDTDVYINKVLPVTIDAQWDDYVEFEVWLKDDSLMVSKYGETIYVYDALPGQWFQGAGAGKMPNFCKVKCVYHKAAGSIRKFIAIVEFII